MMWPQDVSGAQPGINALFATRSATGSSAVSLNDGTVRISTTTAPNTQTLPAAASCSGSTFTFKKVTNDANAATVKTTGTETIDGATSVDLISQYEALSVQSNGVSFDVLFRG